MHFAPLASKLTPGILNKVNKSNGSFSNYFMLEYPQFIPSYGGTNSGMVEISMDMTISKENLLLLLIEFSSVKCF